MIVRPIAHKDLDSLQLIAEESGPGFTSLLNDRDFLARKIQRSVDSFASDLLQPADESYLFVLEDEQTGEVMGTSGIEASVGFQQPLYHFHESQLHNCTPRLDQHSQPGLLSLHQPYKGCTEICTLFLRKQFRRAYAGKLLSRVRFLFMAQNPHRFASTVIAEMRGISSGSGLSPFWNWLRPYLGDMDFTSVTRMVSGDSAAFIKHYLPDHSLYAHSLTPEAGQAIGKVHPQTTPALRLLESEGFSYRGYVDLFDAGPTVEAKRGRIRSIREAVSCPTQVVSHLAGNRHPAAIRSPLILANNSVSGFRATVSDSCRYLPGQHLLQVPPEVAGQLELRNGALIHYLPLEASAAEFQKGINHIPRTQEVRHAL